MARLLFNGKCYSGKQDTLMFNGLNYSYSSQIQYALEPNALDVVGGASGYNRAVPMGFIEVLQGNATASSVTSRNNEYCFLLGPTSNSCVGLTEKIDKSCKRIELDIEAVGTSGEWQLAQVFICGSPAPSGPWSPTDVKQYITLISYHSSVANINSQNYVTFETPLTVNTTLPKQTVTIDIESMNLTDDFYIVLQHCDSYFYVRSVKCIF